MKNTIDLTKLLKVGDKVWSNAIGDTVEIVSIKSGRFNTITYRLNELPDSFCTNAYGYARVIDKAITDDAIPDLVPSKDNWDWSTFRKDLPIDTACMVSDDRQDWCLRHYAGNGKVCNGGCTSKDTSYTWFWVYIIPDLQLEF